MRRYLIGSLTRHKPLGNSSIDSDSKATIYDVFLIITIYYETELPVGAGCRARHCCNRGNVWLLRNEKASDHIIEPEFNHQYLGK